MTITEELHEANLHAIFVKRMASELPAAINEMISVHSKFGAGKDLKEIKEELDSAIEAGAFAEWSMDTDASDFPNDPNLFEEEFGENSTEYLEGLSAPKAPTDWQEDKALVMIDYLGSDGAEAKLAQVIRMMVGLLRDIHEGFTFGLCETDGDLIVGAVLEASRLLDEEIEGGA